MRRLRFALAFLILTLNAYAQAATLEFERVLLPIYLPQPVGGNFGVFWSTDTLLFADTAAPLRLFPGCSAASEFCDLEPRATLRLENSIPATPSRSRFVYLAPQADGARFSACLQHGDPNAACTPMPVVRAGDFRQRIVLPFVPLRPNLRAALRIYGATAAAATVRVRFYRLDRLEPLVDELINLDGRAADPAGFDPEPAFFGVTDLVARWPQLQAAASVRIEIDSTGAASPVWAFASTTSNVTQQVEVFAPK